jgi:large subunit ribosomal protein L18Ae
MVKKTPGSIEQKSLGQAQKQYEIVGRAAPTQKVPVPKIYKLKLFAKSLVIARSKFWYFMKRINKAKRSGGEVLRITELFDARPSKVNNYGIWMRYNSRTDTHNMYKEYRDTTINGAVAQMISEMAGRHRAQCESIQILKTGIIADKDLRRNCNIQMTPRNLKFPVVRRTPLTHKTVKKTFLAKRPTTYAK